MKPLCPVTQSSQQQWGGGGAVGRSQESDVEGIEERKEDSRQLLKTIRQLRVLWVQGRPVTPLRYSGGGAQNPGFTKALPCVAAEAWISLQNK